MVMFLLGFLSAIAFIGAMVYLDDSAFRWHEEAQRKRRESENAP